MASTLNNGARSPTRLPLRREFSIVYANTDYPVKTASARKTVLWSASPPRKLRPFHALRSFTKASGDCLRGQIPAGGNERWECKLARQPRTSKGFALTRPPQPRDILTAGSRRVHEEYQRCT
jgi:hypothetical protein